MGERGRKKELAEEDIQLWYISSETLAVPQGALELRGSHELQWVQARWPDLYTPPQLLDVGCPVRVVWSWLWLFSALEQRKWHRFSRPGHKRWCLFHWITWTWSSKLPDKKCDHSETTCCKVPYRLWLAIQPRLYNCERTNLQMIPASSHWVTPNLLVFPIEVLEIMEQRQDILAVP